MFPGVHARSHPDRAAVVMAGSGETVTYAELDERSIRLARLWHDRGLRRGDHVAILLENHVRYFEIVWAALRSGLYYTPINWHLTADEVEHLVVDCGARSLVTSTARADQIGELDVEIPLMVAGDGVAVDGWQDYESAVAVHDPVPLDDQPEGAGMFYSSGTTGRPKGILFPLPDRQVHDDNPLMIPDSPLGLGPDCSYLIPAPLYHTSPVVTGTMCHRWGGTCVVMERWDPEACLAAIERHRVDTAQFVPTMFVRLLKLPVEVRDRHDISTLTRVTHAAAPCPVEVKRQMLAWWGPIIWEFYAGSENVGSTLVGPDEWLAHPGSVGLPQRCTIHICDDDHVEVEAGQIGNIWFDTPGAAMEYHTDPEKTAASRSPEGWFTMGDIGYVDDDGYLYLTDRKTFMIISGGVNIYPQESEDVLVMHPEVLDVAVIGVPDDDLGEVAKAIVQPADAAAIGPELESELLAYCEAHLSRHKCPRTIDFVDELPRQDTGKLYKRLLRDRYWGDRNSRIV